MRRDKQEEVRALFFGQNCECPCVTVTLHDLCFGFSPALLQHLSVTDLSSLTSPLVCKLKPPRFDLLGRVKGHFTPAVLFGINMSDEV